MSFRRDQSAATAIEYALIAGLVFVAIVAGLESYASSADRLYAKIRTAITDH